MVRPSKVQIRQGGQRDGCGEAEVSYLCLEVDPIVRQDSHHGSVFTQLSKKPTSGIDCCDATHSRGLVSIYGLVVPTSAARRSATLLILSRRGAIFDRSERLRSSKYGAYPTISFSMSSTVCGLRPGIPNGHSSSSFAFAVSSYRPSSFFLSRSSCVIWSSNGYTEPGDGLHHPCVIVSISSMISAPFFGAFARIEMIHVRKPLRRCIIQRKGGNMFVGESYRITDIYPLQLESVFQYRKSDMRKYRPCNTPRGGIHHGKHASGS